MISAARSHYGRINREVAHAAHGGMRRRQSPRHPRAFVWCAPLFGRRVSKAQGRRQCALAHQCQWGMHGGWGTTRAYKGNKTLGLKGKPTTPPNTVSNCLGLVMDATRHAGVTTMAARAATAKERTFLQNDAAVTTGKRSRTKPSRFEAGAAQVRGSRQFEKRPSPPPRAASCPPAPRNRTDNVERDRRQKAAREAYAKAIEELVDNTFVDLSWEQRRAVAVCSYARALSEGCAKMPTARVASTGSRVHERTVRRFVKEWLANEGFLQRSGCAHARASAQR